MNYFIKNKYKLLTNPLVYCCNRTLSATATCDKAFVTTSGGAKSGKPCPKFSGLYSAASWLYSIL